MQTLKGIVKGIIYALEGYAYAFKNDRHFVINFFLAFFASFASLILLKPPISICVATVNILVAVVELINTAVERAVDTATAQWTKTAKAAKDVSAAAVLTIGLFALALDVVYLLPAIVHKIPFL